MIFDRVTGILDGTLTHIQKPVGLQVHFDKKGNSQSLSLPHMENDVHFFLLTDISYVSDCEFKGIG